MTRVGLIARADMGGLATLTHAFFEHMRPAHTVVVDMGLVARGDNVLDYVPDSDQTVEWARWRTEEIGFAYERMVGEVDVIYTAETVYDPRLYALAHARRRVPIVLHAMPELLSKGDRLMADAVWFPTSWYTDETSTVMPVPVSRVVDAPSSTGDPRIFFHTCGEAMLDRNGTEIVRQAFSMVEQECILFLRCGPSIADRDWYSPDDNVDFHFLGPVDHYAKTIPQVTEVMVLPRRYGGLCLPFQEAAARGAATVMSDLDPQRKWPGVWRVRATEGRRVEMKGGWFPTYDVDPRELADQIDVIADPVNAEVVDAHRRAAREWAIEHEWSRWVDPYTEALARVAESVA